jgi:hypothetical protein
MEPLEAELDALAEPNRDEPLLQQETAQDSGQTQ